MRFDLLTAYFYKTIFIQKWITEIPMIEKHERFVFCFKICNNILNLDGFVPQSRFNHSSIRQVSPIHFCLMDFPPCTQNVIFIFPVGFRSKILCWHKRISSMNGVYSIILTIFSYIIQAAGDQHASGPLFSKCAFFCIKCLRGC